MIDLILEMPMELKVILGSGLIMVLYQYRKERSMGKIKTKKSQVKKILKKRISK